MRPLNSVVPGFGRHLRLLASLTLLAVIGFAGCNRADVTPGSEPTITTQVTDLPDSAAGQSLDFTFTVNGAGPMTWTVSAGALPDGVVLDQSSGRITGTPTTTGSYTFTLRVTGPGGSTSQEFTIEVGAELVAPTITTASLAGGTVSAAYTDQLEATGSTPLTWSVRTGSLPAGVQLDAETGALTGTPTTEETASFTVAAANGAGEDTATLEIVVGPAPVAPQITTTTLPEATVGDAYSQQLAATGTAPITWSFDNGSLPAGLSLNATTGVIAGTPTTAGTSDFRAIATNAGGNDTQTLQIITNEAPTAPSISAPSGALPDATLDEVMGFNSVASGTTPMTWSISAGALPTGVSIDSGTGSISGTPTVAGTFNFTVRAVNSVGNDEVATSLDVVAPPTITTLTPNTGQPGLTVVITGTGYSATPSENTVNFGPSNPATVTAASTTELRVEVPVGTTAGSVDVTVTNDGRTSEAEAFTVVVPTVWFVDGSATGADDGSSWTNAFTDIQDALTAASAGDEVWVAAGTYRPGNLTTDTYSVSTELGLYGGFAGTEATRFQADPLANVTILDGDVNGDDVGFTNNSENIETLITASGTALTVEGFTFTRAAGASSGGGIDLQAGELTVINCVFDGNSATDGPAIFSNGAGDLTIRDCRFVGNQGLDDASAVFAVSTGRTYAVDRCVFDSNTAVYGGAVVLYGNVVVVRDSVFWGNSSTYWGRSAYLLGATSTEARGCTFAESSGGASIDVRISGQSGTMTDCILRSSASMPVSDETTGGLTVTTCNITGGFAAVSGGAVDGGGNFDADPLFVDDTDPDGADDLWGTVDDGLQLDTLSPCLDTGTTSGASATDIIGTTRPAGVGVDIGAYEKPVT